MSFRARLLVAFAATSLLSLTLLAVGVRRQLTTRLVAQDERRAGALAQIAIQDLLREEADVSTRLRGLARSLGADNRARLAIRGSSDERPYLLDWAGDAMRLAGLSMLQLQDDAGRILSSGHFREEFDRLDPALPALLATSADRVTIAAVRAPTGPFLALVREDSLMIAGRRLYLVGGVTIDRAFLDRFARDSEVSVALITPDTTLASDAAALASVLVSSSASSPTAGSSGGPASSAAASSSLAQPSPAHAASVDAGSPARRVAAEQPLAYIGPRHDPNSTAALAPARLVVAHSNAELSALRRDTNRWFAFALATAALAGLALAAWMSSGLSRPLAALTRATSTIALEGPELEIATGRDDEIGALARRFGAMGRRLRASAAQLRDAERRATVGEMARQVNHDIKNGLIPIRNVIHHLAEVQSRDPDQVSSVFSERRATLEASIAYLDALARNYARLSAPAERRVFDAGAVAREAARSAATGGAAVVTRIPDSLPPVFGDPVALRRVLDNLLRNAIESFPAGAPGQVTIELARRGPAPAGGTGAGVRLTVADTGRGMSPDELAHAFDDFHTTKAHGTGLGLSVVRRLAADLQADLRVDSAPGKGTRFTLDLPPAPAPAASRELPAGGPTPTSAYTPAREARRS